MRVLMVSPHPTYSPRGTPISVLNRCRALGSLGHDVDLVTYGIGQDVPVRGLRYLRAPVPGLTSVKVGPSLAKVPLDGAVFAKALGMLTTRTRDYDVLHTHEEAGALGLVSRLPHVYDMGNDLEVVMLNYGFGARNPLTRGIALAERTVVKHSDVVIAHFDSIAAKVAAVSHGTVPSQVVSNVALEAAADPFLTGALRRTWSPDGQPVALYTGTLETYQGLDAMVDAMDLLRSRGLKVRLVIVGGQPAQRELLAARVADLNLQDLVVIAEPVAQQHIQSYLAAADILVSPRSAGSNTPLKIFSYLRSARAILATRIESHTQVLDDTSACLVEPGPHGLAAGLQVLIEDTVRAEALAAVAGRMAEQRYDVRAYVGQVAQAYAHVGAALPTDSELDNAVQSLQAELVAGVSA